MNSAPALTPRDVPYLLPSLQQDTPDFFREDDYGKDIDVMDGVMGSSIQNVKKDRSNDPGVAGAVSPFPPAFVPFPVRSMGFVPPAG